MVRGRLIVFLSAVTVILFGVIFARSAMVGRHWSHRLVSTRTLRVLTYSTFASATGAGPTVIPYFEQDCQCRVEIETAGDAGLILERAHLADQSNPFDVVIGLDQIMIQQAQKKMKWRAINTAGVPFVESIRSDLNARFVPYDWSPLTFIYRKGETVPQKFDDIVDPRFAGMFAIQDPRSSSPGLQLYQWIRTLEKNKTEDFLKAFRPNVQSIAPSWSFSYGLFRKGQAAFVFSYLTSLVYHWGVDNDFNYQAMNFPEGHPYQVEYVAIPEKCQQCELATEFVHKMISQPWQEVLAEKNFMLPVVRSVRLSQAYSKLPRLKLISVDKNADLSLWLKIFRK